MHCFWCHNSYLIPYDYSPGRPPFEEDDCYHFLGERTNLIDAVVVSGGEPTLHGDLLVFCERIKALGFHVKLDTNGSNPKILRDLMDNSLLDYVAMDIKTCAELYAKLYRDKVEWEDILASIDVIQSGNIPYEFRTTCATPFVCRDNIEDVAKMIKGAKQYYLQECTEQKNTNGNGRYQALDGEELIELKARAAPYVQMCEIR